MGGRAPSSNPPPDFATALSATRRFVNRRSARYRDLVIAVSLVALAVPASSLTLWDWRFLVCGLLLVPLVGLFLLFDARSVGRRRSDILDGWVVGALDLDALRDGLTAIKLLPARTIAGLVDPLPTRARLECFPDPKPLVREALATMVRAIDRLQMNRLIASVAALTVVAALIALAAALGSLWSLTGVPIVYGIGKVAQHLSLRRPRSWVSRMAEWKGRGLDVEAFTRLAGRLDWESLPARVREKWLSTWNSLDR